MPKIKSFHVGNGDTFYIKHGSDNFTVIDCNLIEDRKKEIMDEIIAESKNKGIRRFISTHPDDDHILGLDYFYDRQEIINFYVVNNNVKKDDETESFKFYKKLRDDDKKAFYIYKGCSRKWMNESSDERGSSGISILWPDTGSAEFQAELETANESGHPNNISPIVQYSTGDIRFLWFGDLEHHFMESIQDKIGMPAADVVFAPHHGRLSGAVPQKWLEQINPKVIIIGAAPSSELKYFTNYNQITQNSAWDITMYCDDNMVHIYSSNANYEKRDFLTDESRSNKPRFCPSVVGDEKNDVNNFSIVQVLEYGEFKVVLTGDNSCDKLIEMMNQTGFKDSVRNATVLLAPHHGRDTQFCKEFVELVNPRLTVFSDKPIQHETQAHSAQKYLAQTRGVTWDGQTRYVLTTRNDGTITFEFRTDGWSIDMSATEY